MTDSSVFYDIGAIIISVTIPLIKFSLISHILRWDSCAFLNNAMWFAGYNIEPEIERPPFLPYIISIGFRIFGIIDIVAFIISAFFYMLAILGCYKILSMFFNPKYSLVGAIAFAITPPVYEWGGIIYTHVEVVALMIWTLLTLVKALTVNKKYLYISIPLFGLCFLTRYSGFLILFSIIAYY
jgi:4-amino-4-deoxy-L-arabinose transferase-like glycosyltransferase